MAPESLILPCLILSGLFHKGGNGKAVTVKAEAADYATACRRNHGVVTELLTCMYVRDMYFYDRTSQRPYAVMQSHRGVSVSSGIKHYAVVRKAYLLHLVYHDPFNIALEVFYLYTGKSLAQCREILLK